MDTASRENSNHAQFAKGTKRKHPVLKQAQRFNKKLRITNDFPTLDDLDEFLVDGASFHSSLFRMQVKEMMTEVKLQMNKKHKLVEWLNTFTSFLIGLPESEFYSINDLSWMNEVSFPIIKLPEETEGMFKFRPPSDIKEIGSFVQNTMCAPEPVIDIALEIPKAVWKKTDFLNQRYHRKRALYLTYIAQCLLKTNLVHSIKFTYQQNSYLKPVLLIKPKGKFVKSFSIILYGYPQKDAFVENRFIPLRNNVRENCYSIEKIDNVEIPTPHYNATILADLLLPDLNLFLKENITSPNVVEGIILLKIWCIQRGLLSGRYRINGFFIAMFVAFLLKKQKITSAMTSYQIFRSTLIAFQSEDLLHGITLCDNNEKSQSTVEEFQKSYDVVFLDPSGRFNICYFVSKETVCMLQHEAKLAIKILSQSISNNFDLLFMNKIAFCQKFEHLLNLSGSKVFQTCFEKLNLNKKQLDCGEDVTAAIFSEICSVLRKGLKTRISLLDVEVVSREKWPVSIAPPDPNVCTLRIGLLLNPDVPPNNIEKGPETHDPEAQEFLSFWGDKSEIRRFKDSTICETVSWPAETIEDKRNVLSSMIKYILERHLGIEGQFVHISGTNTSSILSYPSPLMPSEFPSYGTGEEAFTRIMNSFDSLSKQLRNLKGLPLLISSIQGTSPSLRFTETFPPIPVLHSLKKKICDVEGHVLKFISDDVVRAPPYVPVTTVILSFEGSGKWPDDVDAIRKMKTAFYIKIASLAHSQYSLTTVAFPNYIDVLKDGYIFRLEIVSHKEIILLRQIRLPNGMLKVRETKEYRTLHCRTKGLPILSSVISGLYQLHNSYGTACRLAKRWISSQLLHGYLHSISIELLMAYVYINPEPYTCPSLPQVAFLRFLRLLHTYYWDTSPLIVDITKELTKSDEEQINASFQSHRSAYPPMTIITPLDKSGAMWTKNMPPSIVLKRLVELAKASSEILQNQLCSTKEIDIKEIFRPPLLPYDAIIKLKPLQVPLRSLAIDYPGSSKVIPEPYVWQNKEKYPIVDYNPIKLYLKELRENFDDIALFFYDEFGGDYIAVAFNPSQFKPSKFTASHSNCRSVIENTEDNEVNIILNLEAILEDFKKLGSGLIKDIKLNG